MVFVGPEKLKDVDDGTQQQRRHPMKLAITHQTPEFYQCRLTWIQTQILILLTKITGKPLQTKSVWGVERQECLSFVFTSFLNIGPCDSSGKCSGLKAPSLAENFQWVQETWSVPGTSAVVILNFLKSCAQGTAEECVEIFFALAST